MEDKVLFKATNSVTELTSTITVSTWALMREAILWSRTDDGLIYYSDVKSSELESTIDTLQSIESTEDITKVLVLASCEVKYRKLLNL